MHAQAAPVAGGAPTRNAKLLQWVERVAALTQPDRIHWCDGSDAEYDRLCAELVAAGTFRQLDGKLRPNSYLAWSDPTDVARVEDRTFICSRTKDEAGPTNNWVDPSEMRSTLDGLFKGCMRGRTMYVVPVQHGPPRIPHRADRRGDLRFGLRRREHEAHDPHGPQGARRTGRRRLRPCLHSVGVPLAPGQKDVPGRATRTTSTSCTSPRPRKSCPSDRDTAATRSLGKKCLALRIASVMGREQGWLAEHMLILGVESPAGDKHYVTAAFPSACGKTNFAMLIPPPAFKGWKVTTIGDDIAWIKPHKDGRLYAINPEAGFFGVAPGTGWDTNPNCMETIKRDTIFTNVALTPEGDVWWEGMTQGAAARSSPTGPAGIGRRAAGARPRTPTRASPSPAAQCPSIDEHWDNPEGVPIDAFVFGGRRSTTVPLVTEAKSWSDGVYMAATLGSETTAAITGQVGVVRRDPFAMIAFCGYNMSDYFAHWLALGKTLARAPKIYLVNWFRKDANGKFIWPGYGENMRVLKWIIERVEGKAQAQDTPLGHVPAALDMNGLESFPPERLAQATAVETPRWAEEMKLHAEMLDNKLEGRAPAELKRRFAELDAAFR